MTIAVHSSFKSMGNICGGAQSVIMALENVLGENGTLTMPTHSCGLTPTRKLGFIPETFRNQNFTVWSDHPHVSWAARGKNAAQITDDHTLENGCGEQSPLARLYELKAWVLLIGVNHRVNTSMHLAEYRASYPGHKRIRTAAPVLHNGMRVWKEFEDIDLNDRDFEEIGNAFNAKGHAKQGLIGDAPSLLMNQREIVDFAVQWMNERR